MLYGHRRNAEGYGRQIEHIDKRLSEIIPLIGKDDLLILSADHGNDPTYRGTDHTREFTPLICYSPQLGEDLFSKRRLNDRESFADLGQTICENFELPLMDSGQSFLGEFRN